ncbi:CHAP domain-containing protein [Bradyrhizobium oligotrophicum]|uniref:CHAP domain-containing protein n=1 Tax=Bradyrhizobium TaxID=374 RepID=UPI003EB8E0D6
MNRRELLLLSAVAIGARSIGGAEALAQAAPSDIELVSELPPLPVDLQDKTSLPPAPYVETQLVGTAPPTPDEVEKAYDLMVNAPYGGAPIDVAQYFLAVGAGAYGQEYRPFAREWPIRANPLIFQFFTSTQTKPEGDVTAWCAAFVNWCLLRAHATSPDEIGQTPDFFFKKGRPFPPENLSQYSTNNASSGSFRCWDAVASPNRGNVVVFKDAGTESLTPKCRGSGHVAFFVKVPADGLVQVLGGNQSQAGSNGAVTIANMSTRPGSRFMKYVSLKG